MKVVYNDPDGRTGTYHPKLGYLESGKSFELSADVAGQYIRSGLLKKAETKKNKNSAFAPLREGKEEVKDGKSTDR
ncbi:MAG: hypothetical protein JRD89_10720 [Deltaproteobacteria bacterium]|nr:hypothetical protein [Deltaproteobacteria bacterium]